MHAQTAESNLLRTNAGKVSLWITNVAFAVLHAPVNFHAHLKPITQDLPEHVQPLSVRDAFVAPCKFRKSGRLRARPSLLIVPLGVDPPGLAASSDMSNLRLVAQNNFANRIYSSIALALLYYDFLLTVPLEVERYWKGTRSWASFFFFLIRYFVLLSHIPVVYEFFFVMPEFRCRQLQTYHNLVACLTQGFVAILMILRTYALYIRDRRILYFLIMITVIAAAVSIWAVTSVHAATFDARPLDSIMSTGCDFTLSATQGVHLAIAWSSILVFDATVFTLTVTQVIRMGQVWSRGVFYLMLRDGTVYFAILSVFYLMNILSYAFAQPINRGALATFTNVLSTVLITRMMLNIRDPKLFELPHYWRSGRSEAAWNDAIPTLV